MTDTVRMRRPPFADGDGEHRSGSVGFDDRGNAVWLWSSDVLRNGTPDLPDLTLADAPVTRVPLAEPKRAVAHSSPASGYNPYASGMVDREASARPRKRDLRELSKWIERRKTLGDDSGGG